MTLFGTSRPLGIAAPNWQSGLIGAHILKFLLEEVLGYNVIFSAIESSVITVFAQLAGCNTSVDFGEDRECKQLPIHHLAWEVWAVVINIELLSKFLQERTPVSLGQCGFSGREGAFINRGVIDRFYERTGQSLAFYPAWNSSWTDPAPYFANYSSIPTSRLKRCSNTSLYSQELIQGYSTWSGDVAGTEVIDGRIVGRCEGGQVGHWWLSPACRQMHSKCVPWITYGEGWGLAQIMARAAAYHIPLAVSVAASWNDYISLPWQHPIMFYWWTPDSTFQTYSPVRIAFPSFDPRAWRKKDYRTDQDVVYPEKYSHHELGTIAAPAREMFARMSLSNGDLDAMLLDAALSQRSNEEVACEWLRNNDQTWSDWIPLATLCQKGWGLTFRDGSYSLDRVNAVSCSWCEPGRYSKQIKDDLGATFVCQKCEAGRFQHHIGLSSCTDCLVGTFQSDTGAADCNKCAPGTVSGEVGSSICTPCVEGFYADNSGMTLCLPCMTGSFSNSTESSGCLRCPEGSYASTYGASLCNSCEPGSFAAIEGMSFCKTCAAGTFANTTMSSECPLCSTGSYTEKAGMSSCVSCGVGKATPALWATMTRLQWFDQTNWMYSTGANRHEDCGCMIDAQYYGDECVPCSATVGMTCVGMGEVLIQSGFAWDHELSVYSCFGNALRCPGGMRGACALGRDDQSIACSKCLPGMTSSSDGACQMCEVGGGRFVAATVVLLLGLVAIYIATGALAGGDPRRSTAVTLSVIAQAITLVQNLTIMGAFAIKSQEPMTSVWAITDTLSFKLNTLQLDCIFFDAESTRFMVRASLVVIAIMWVVLIHIVHLLGRRLVYKETQTLQHHSTLLNTLGSLILLSFIPSLHTILSPYQCDQHPNGERTVSEYPSVWCSHGFADRHYRSMVITSSVSMIIPVTFLAISANAVRQYPHKMRRSNVFFLRNFRFLFVRFKPESYWYAFFLLVRNAVVTLIPVIGSVMMQVFALQVVVLVSIIVIVARQPWTTQLANVLDVLCHSGVMMFACLLTFANERSYNPGEELFKGMCVIASLLFLSLFIGLAFVVKAAFLGILRPVAFRFFLCHHKAGSGSFARALTLLLSYARQRVFLDCDNFNLKDMPSLFGCIAFQTRTFVILCSRDLFTRPWCLGQIATAYSRTVLTTLVNLPGFELYDAGWVSNFSNRVDISCLTPHDIDAPMLEDTLRWVPTNPSIQMPSKISLPVVEGVVMMLIDSSFGEVPLPESNPTTFRCGQIVMALDPLNFEAVSTAIVLRALLGPYMTHQPELAPVLHLSTDREDLASMRTLMVICTSNVFQQVIVLDAIEFASQRVARMLPILASDSFRFPDALFWDTHQSFWKAIGRDDVGLKVNVTFLFDEIACVFDPSNFSATQQVLTTGAYEIAQRLTKKEMSFTDTLRGVHTSSYRHNRWCCCRTALSRPRIAPA